MRKRVLKFLQCPNGGGTEFMLFGAEVKRQGEFHQGLMHDELRDDDDVLEGVLVCTASGSAYPISGAVCKLLSDTDTDIEQHEELLADIREQCPPDVQAAIEQTSSRLRDRPEDVEGLWNREEMEYYDASVRTPEQRAALLGRIRSQRLWDLYLPRWQDMVSYFATDLAGGRVLEAGCGNARTMSRICPPAQYGYEYVGIDISWRRLLLAKAVIPAGDFFQASVLNLPFRDGAFNAVVGFGVFHHLPRPVDGIRCTTEKLARGGYLGLQEPIDTPKLFTEGTKLQKAVHGALEGYEHSEHDNEIPLDDTLALLKESQMPVVAQKLTHSVIRPLLYRVIMKIPGLRDSRWVFQLLFALDRLMVKTVCRLWPRLGPRGVILVARNGEL